MNKPQPVPWVEVKATGGKLSAKQQVLRLAEADVTRTVRDFLEARGWRPVRINAGPFGQNGMPDYVFLHYRESRILWIEFKATGRKLSAKQQAWITAEQRRGAAVCVVDDPDAFIAWYRGPYAGA